MSKGSPGTVQHALKASLTYCQQWELSSLSGCTGLEWPVTKGPYSTLPKHQRICPWPTREVAQVCQPRRPNNIQELEEQILTSSAALPPQRCFQYFSDLIPTDKESPPNSPASATIMESHLFDFLFTFFTKHNICYLWITCSVCMCISTNEKWRQRKTTDCRHKSIYSPHQISTKLLLIIFNSCSLWVICVWDESGRPQWSSHVFALAPSASIYMEKGMGGPFLSVRSLPARQTHFTVMKSSPRPLTQEALCTLPSPKRHQWRR